MIYLHTGLPGAGKTLFTLAHVKPLAEKEGRQVYFFNIPELKIPDWRELTEDEFLKWWELPANSIIVADEAQRIFRPRGTGTKVPEHVAKLETHRHYGLDLYLITQHPGLVDLNVRKLVGTHRHVVRSFGSKHAVVHAWGQVKDNCDKSRSDSVKTQFRYPKEVFNWYKSAEVHTHKATFPFRVLVLPVLVVVVGSASYYAYSGLTTGNVATVQDTILKAQGKTPGAGGSVAGGSVQGEAVRYKPITQVEYIDSLTPRVPDLAYSAPRYDEVTKPVDAPFPVGCIQSRAICKCYTQQGTTYKASADFCQNFIEHGGIFRDWMPPSAGEAVSKTPL